jgi:hypothetical protein
MNMPTAKGSSATKKSAKTKEVKKSADVVSLSIDFPEEGASIYPGHYAVRISSSLSEPVEISVNGSPWESCREASGYFWFDWWPEETGKTSISVRSKSTAGKTAKTSARTCTVIAPHSN